MLMPVIAPTVTAYDEAVYKEQMQLVSSFADRVHIDLMDGDFAPTKSPELDKVWWPKHVQADLHLMYRRPMEHLETILHMKQHPHMVIVHNEAEVHHMHLAAELHKEDIKVGLAVLQDTPIEWTEQILHSFDHVLIFSGDLGHHGGEADLGLLEKVAFIHDLHPEVEVGWDGGINESNARSLVDAGVHVLNVGGGIHGADDPKQAYATLKEKLS
jgi:ribulose-phosphate 3-epimerase